MDLTTLNHNPPSKIVEGLQILQRLLENVVLDPNDAKYRTLNLENKTIKNKLMCLRGITSILTTIGYKQEHDNVADRLILSSSVMIGQIKNYIQQLSDQLEHIRNPSAPRIADITPATTGTISKHSDAASVFTAVKPYLQRIQFESVLTTDNAFLRQIEFQSDHVLQYEDAPLLAIGRSMIPTERLTFQATQRLRSLQRDIKTGAAADATEPCIDDLMLGELVDWFKGTFFEWVNALPCTACGNERPPSCGVHIENGTRVEVSECCGRTIRFHRYNDVAQLLRTRRGRCGEFANAFTFLCRCLGYEARLVVATFDHVWTEVYSSTMRRWIHIDPSDGVIDAPLMYQHGWRRPVDYVIGYSRFDVQDVTHRYSNAHAELASKRTRCTETDLVDAIQRLQRKRQTNCSRVHQRQLDKRTLLELADLMTPAQVRDNERNGRSSGDSLWKMSRGEQMADNVFEFSLIDEEITSKQFNVRYSTAANCYERYIADGTVVRKLRSLPDWSTCILQHSNIMRKVEHDWKMTYLARTEDSESASISWKFDFSASGLRIKSVSLKCLTKTYETGVVQVDIFNDKDEKVNSTAELANRTGFRMACSLTGGTGGNAWQHTQLFRQSTDGADFPFELNVVFV